LEEGEKARLEERKIGGREKNPREVPEMVPLFSRVGGRNRRLGIGEKVTCREGDKGNERTKKRDGDCQQIEADNPPPKPNRKGESDRKRKQTKSVTEPSAWEERVGGLSARKQHQWGALGNGGDTGGDQMRGENRPGTAKAYNSW